MVGEHGQEFTVPQIGEYPELFEEIKNHFPKEVNFSAIKPRFSKTQERTYLSNGCAHCDAIVGEFFEHHAWYDQTDVCSFEIVINELWYKALTNSQED